MNKRETGPFGTNAKAAWVPIPRRRRGENVKAWSSRVWKAAYNLASEDGRVEIEARIKRSVDEAVKEAVKEERARLEYRMLEARVQLVTSLASMVNEGLIHIPRI